MAIEVIELSLESQSGELSRDGRETRAERVYLVTGTEILDSALQAVDNVAPEMWRGLKKRRLGHEPMSNDKWKVRVAYDAMRRLLVNEFEYEFDIGTQNQRITQSKGTSYYRVPGTGPQTNPFFAGAINVQDGKVQGVDVLLPTYQWSETYILPASEVTEGYKNTLYQLTGTKNNAPFRAKAAGEVLFVGARGRLRNENEFSLQYQFVASPNVTNLNVNGMLITKKGHDFIWFIYGDVVDGGTSSIVKRPQYAYVEKVYEDADFSLLGIGT